MTTAAGNDVAVQRGATDGAIVAVSFTDGATRRLPALWLRDGCPCGACRIAGTGRRIVEAMAIPLDVSVDRVDVTDDGASVVIAWSDGHIGAFPAPSLRADDEASESGPAARRWNAADLVAPPTFTFDDVVADGTVTTNWLTAVVERGVAVLSGAPTDRDALHRLTAVLGPVRPSNYGPDWDIETTSDPSSPVDSTAALSPHTDLPYRVFPPGLQLLLCAVADAPGGATTLVDGHRIAEDLRDEHVDDWRVLTTEAVPFRYRDGSFDLRHAAPVIGVEADGSPGVIRHAPGIMGPLPAEPKRFAAVYGALHRFTARTNDPDYQLLHRLEPGQVLTIDNHRVLHGRTAIDLRGGGHRRLHGSYTDLDDLHSALRIRRRRPETSHP